MPVTNIDVENLIQQLSDLRIRVAQLEAAATERDPSIESVVATDFAPGDRVVVKNEVKRPTYWRGENDWDQEAAQRATVTHLYRDQVHFLTDNGISTWRARGNLKKV